MEWVVYLVINKNCTYVGMTNNFKRRLRQHNGELVGGAKYTRMKGPGWECVCLIKGFTDKINTLRCEWAIQHCAPRKAYGIKNRIKKLIKVLNQEKWTSKSPLANEIPLTIKWEKVEYRPDDIILPNYVLEELHESQDSK